MAGNSQHTASKLNKHLTQSRQTDNSEGGHRPYLSTLVNDASEAERWYRHVTKEAIQKIGEVQNSNLNMSDAMSTNDYINKLMRERHHWHRRIRQLGGNAPVESQLFDANNVVCVDKYYYFGVTKNHPMVKKLISKKRDELVNRYTYAQLQALVSGVLYYDDVGGWGDKELLEVEAEAEKRLREEAGYDERVADDTDMTSASNNDQTEALTAEQVESMLVDRRKAELLAKYG